MESQCKDDTDEEMRLTEKLTELEQKMKQLQQNLMDEKLKLNMERLGEGDELPDNWAAMNRLHLPQCPLAKMAYSPTKKTQVCPLHGNKLNGTVSLSSSRNFGKADDYNLVDSDRYSKMINDAESYMKVSSMNEKFRELYESSIFSPTFYRPRNTNDGLENDLERRLIRYKRESSEEASSHSNERNKSFDSSEEISLTRQTSNSNPSAPSPRSGSQEQPLSIKNKDISLHSEDDASSNAYNPFGAIVNVRNKFMDFETYVQEATHKSRLKEIS